MSVKALRALVEQHPESVARLFAAHGIEAEPTFKNLNTACRAQGEKFVDAVNDWHDSFSNYDGDKRTPWQVGADGLIRYLGEQQELQFYRDGRINQAPGTVVTPDGRILISQPNYTPLRQFDNQEPDRILGINKHLFFVLCGILGALVILELYKRK